MVVTFSEAREHALLPSYDSRLKMVSTAFRASWATTIAFDTLISVLTISKTYHMHRENRRVGIESRLATMLLQDGS